MIIEVNTDLATIISATSSAIYAVVSTISLGLLARQIRDARRFGAAPALYALLKEMDDHMAAVRQLDTAGIEDPLARETISRCLEFFERIEHLRRAGVISATTLRGAFGPVLDAYLADPRFSEVVRQDPGRHEEVLLLKKRIGRQR